MEVYAYHTFTEQGAYIVKVKAKDEYDYESDWGFLNIIMPRSKIVSNTYFIKLLVRLLHQFQR